MMSKTTLILLLILAVPGLSATAKGEGSLQVIHHFFEDPGTPTGRLVQGSDGTFYGTTSIGGEFYGGTVFSLTPNGSGGLTYQTLHSFNYVTLDVNNGGFPSAGLVQGSDGAFYGTTRRGGLYNGGTVYRITTAGEFSILHSFFFLETPLAGLALGTDGGLYGVTSGESSSGFGSIFKITISGFYTVLHQGDFGEGIYLAGDLIQGSDGDFYGTAQRGGGPNDKGSLFKITPSGSLTVLHRFDPNDPADGANPYAGLVQASDGCFYGVTVSGGLNNLGTIFKVTSTGDFTNLYSFSGADGAEPYGALVQGSDGALYGTTRIGGASGFGTTFKITTAGSFTSLHSFVASDGSHPYAGMILASDGDFYGLTSDGTDMRGTAFRMTTTGATSTPYVFAWSEPYFPSGKLIQANDGDFYGTSSRGGRYDRGTVYKLTASGTLTVLHSFDGSDGANPFTGLVQGSDGDFYGTTGTGSANGYGTLFRMTAGGALTTLHSFILVDGYAPGSSLIQASDGDFYGTAVLGGPGYGFGSIFKVTSAGVFTKLHDFDYYPDGAYPYGGLVLGADGAFYGTTKSGGANGCQCFPNDYGTTYRFTPPGYVTPNNIVIPDAVFTRLNSFGSVFGQGNSPLVGLTRGSDGNFYSTTHIYAGWSGAAYTMTPTGVVTVLHSFSGDAPVDPFVGLAQGTDGAFYGRTDNIAGIFGTFYRLTTAGDYTIIYESTSREGGYNPTGPMIQASDGAFYATNHDGGFSGRGTAYRIFPLFNTPVGTNVVVRPLDTTTSTRPVTVAFSAITASGDTSLTTNSSGPAPPSGFTLGDPPIYYNLTTTAAYTPPITVCIDYTGVNYTDESQLGLFHYEGGAWVNRTSSVDTAGNVICASVSSLSPFAIFERANADLAVSITDSPDPVTMGSNLTYTVTVTNNGPSVATGVTMTDALPAAVSFVSASSSQGSCTGTTTVTCNLGAVATSTSATVTIVGRPTTAGTISNMASAMAAQNDPNPSNNSAATSTSVTAPLNVTLLSIRDSFLRNGADDTNEGANERLRIQNAGNNRVVVAFDLTGISTAGLQSATLVLTIAENSNNWGASGRLVDAHRLLVDWTEGNGRNDVMVNGVSAFRGSGEGVTWDCGKDTNIFNQSANCSPLWNGGSFAAATAPGVLHTNGLLGQVSWNVTADVLAGANFGWTIKKQDESKNGQVRYYSREGAALAGNASLAPRLVLVYSH